MTNDAAHIIAIANGFSDLRNKGMRILHSVQQHCTPLLLN
jgi:hypothetical protein